MIRTYTLTELEAAYIAAALRVALDNSRNTWTARERKYVNDLLDRLAASMDLDNDVRAVLQEPTGGAQ